MRYLILILAALCCASGSVAQLRGRVIDARSQEPLAGVVVALLDSAERKIAVVSTRANGAFQLRHFVNERSIQVRSLGYIDTVIRLPWQDSIV
ncbi:MAG TPA: carboxypeptidase regulatory-like domain-containing protein, partial [Candidatus Kapabacteria bacterium]|nr:carboxypeptidase regulatory-like domain-containing protein [Candidatus Kapabacteria bacterium]